jgi:hypothetical protein
MKFASAGRRIEFHGSTEFEQFSADRARHKKTPTHGVQGFSQSLGALLSSVQLISFLEQLVQQRLEQLA